MSAKAACWPGTEEHLGALTLDEPRVSRSISCRLMLAIELRQPLRLQMIASTLRRGDVGYGVEVTRGAPRPRGMRRSERVQGVDRLGSNLADKLSGSTMTAIARCVLAIHLGRQIG